MPIPETPRPQCQHVACHEVDRYPFEVSGRNFRLIYEGGCSELAPRIKGFVNDWKEDDKLASFVIKIPDERLLNSKICASVYDDLHRAVESRIMDPQLTEIIVLTPKQYKSVP